MIEATNLSKSFGGKAVFNNTDITVEKGSICGLVGINGAGKSTLLRILSGVMRQDGGEVKINGESVYENERVKSKIFFLPDDPYYDTGVTGEKLKKCIPSFTISTGKFSSTIQINFHSTSKNRYATFQKE